MTFYASVTQGHTYIIEPYLLVLAKPEHKKNAMCRLCTYAHDPQIERGKYSNNAREDRKKKSYQHSERRFAWSRTNCIF